MFYPIEDSGSNVKILGVEHHHCQYIFSFFYVRMNVVVGLPLFFLEVEVWREQQSRFTPST